MITSIRLVNFKNFADETLRVGPFTVIVGANASGKSNIRDAFRFLHGIGRGFTLAEIIGGKFGAGGQVEWEGIRGAMNEVIRFGQTSFTLQVTVDEFTYTIKVGRDENKHGAFRVIGENFAHPNRTIFTSLPGPASFSQVQPNGEHLFLRMGETLPPRRGDNQVKVRADQPALTQIPGHKGVEGNDSACALMVMHALAYMRFLDLEPNRMRQPAFPGQNLLGGRGEYLPTALRAICEDPQRKETLVEWMRELTPMDVRDFEFPTDPSGRVHLVFLEANGRRVSAYAASDGTLRFLTVLTALLWPDSDGLDFFEEIDNGIHAARLWLLLDLIEKQTAKRRILQVVTTTHSPDLLTVMNDETFENTSVVCRLEEADDAIIRAVADLPKAEELRTSQGLGNLLSGGWMEDALAFTEGYDEKVGK